MKPGPAELPAQIQTCARFLQSGRHAEGRQRLRGLLRRWPGQPDALHLLGLAEYNLGELDAAEKHMRAALQRFPDHPAITSNRGLVLRRQGKLAQAVTAFRKAVKKAPDFIDAHVNLLATLVSAGRTSEAEAHAATLPVKLRRHPTIASLAGDAHRLAGEARAARAWYETALKAKPDSLRALTGMAELPAAVVPGAEAIALLERAARVAPTDGAVAAALAARLVHANHLDQALTHVARAQELRPADPAPCLTRASIALRRDDRAQAAACLEAAAPLVEVPAHVAEYHHYRARLALLDRDPAAALSHQRAAKQALLATEAGQRTARDAMPRRVAAYHAWIDASPPGEDADPAVGPAVGPATDADTPVFFVGFPRSGTTLMEQILDAHPRLVAAPELPLVTDLLADLPRLLGRPVSIPDDLVTLGADERAAARDAYRAAFRARVAHPAGRRMVDKMPFNLVEVAAVKALFPRAPILVALRDPRDVVLSCFFHMFAPNVGTVHFTDPEGAARLYAGVMDLWAACAPRFGDGALTYRYEDLVSDFRPTVARVLDFLGVGWDPAVEGYAERAKARYVSTPSASEVIRAPHREGIGRWRAFATELAPVWEDLAPYVARFGYSPA